MNGFTNDVVAEMPVRLRTPPTGRSVREQEEHTVGLRNENFRLKLRIYFMEQQQHKASTASTESGGDPDDCADRLGRENISLRVDLELLRSELFDKQSLLCEAAAGMEEMNRLLQSERLQNGSSYIGHQKSTTNIAISDLMTQSSSSSSINYSVDMKRRFQRDHQLEQMAMKQASDQQLLAEMDRRYEELQDAYRRALLELDGLKEELTNKTSVNNELEMFRAYSKKHFAQQVERLCRENRALNVELCGIKSKIRSFDLTESSLDENLRIIADQSRLMRELHKTIDSKKKSMSSLRSDLDTNEREIRFLRRQNTELLERIQPTESNLCRNRCRLCAPPSLESLSTVAGSTHPSGHSSARPQTKPSPVWPLESRLCASASGLSTVRSATTTLQMSTVYGRLATLPSQWTKMAQMNPAQPQTEPTKIGGISLGEEIDLIGKKSLVGKGLRLFFDRMKS